MKRRPHPQLVNALLASSVMTLGLAAGSIWFLYKYDSRPRLCTTGPPGAPYFTRCGSEIAWDNERERNKLYILLLPAVAASVTAYFALRLKQK